MSAETEALRCSGTKCQVCNLNEKLIEHGAITVSLSELEENRCRLYFEIAATHRCIHGLRLDLDRAEYRYVSKDQDTRMCDFAVLAVNRNVAQLVAIELKSGAAYAEDLEQLGQGLRFCASSSNTTA